MVSITGVRRTQVDRLYYTHPTDSARPGLSPYCVHRRIPRIHPWPALPVVLEKPPARAKSTQPSGERLRQHQTTENPGVTSHGSIRRKYGGSSLASRGEESTRVQQNEEFSATSALRASERPMMKLTLRPHHTTTDGPPKRDEKHALCRTPMAAQGPLTRPNEEHEEIGSKR